MFALAAFALLFAAAPLPAAADLLLENGVVYVADRANKRFQVFTPEGKYVTQVFISRKEAPPSTLQGTTASGTPLHPHDVLRAVLAGHVRRVVVDSQGVVIDMGRKTRLFTGAAREAAKLLVRRCDHAGCDLPEDFCEVDHVTDEEYGA